MPYFALRSLGLPMPVVQDFCCEIDDNAMKFLKHNHKARHHYRDVTQRPTTWPGLDIYVAGPPCQPWSTAGARLGEADPRSALFFSSIVFVEQALPAVAIIENSHKIATYLEGQWLLNVLARLARAGPGYDVQHATVDTRHHGVPQRRIRVYIVCIRKDYGVREFCFPEPLREDQLLTVADLLGPSHPTDDPLRMPPSTWSTACVNVESARAKVQALARSQGDRPGDWMVAHQQGQTFNGPAGARARYEWPCLLHANRMGYWVGRRGREASVEETCRAQGLLASAPHFIPPSTATPFQLLGNSMSGCVLQRIFVALLRQVWLLDLEDPWETGLAQKAMRADAAQDLPRIRRAAGMSLLAASFARNSLPASTSTVAGNAAPDTQANTSVDGLAGGCSRCGGLHLSTACPTFPHERPSHTDAWMLRGHRDDTHCLGQVQEPTVYVFETRIPTAADNSCAYHAMVHGLEGQITAYRLREQLADAVVELAEVQVAGNLVSAWVLWDSGLRPDRYAERMRNPLRWAGGVEFALCAHLFHVHISIYQSVAKAMLPRTRKHVVCLSTFGTPECNRTLHLLYVGRTHYEILQGLHALPAAGPVELIFD